METNQKEEPTFCRPVISRNALLSKLVTAAYQVEANLHPWFFVLLKFSHIYKEEAVMTYF